MNQPAKREGRYAKLLSRARSDAAKCLVSGICQEVTTWEHRSGGRKTIRGPKTQGKLNVAIERFIGDLLNAAANPESGGAVYHQVSPKAFPSDAPVTFDYFRAALKALTALSLVEYLRGKGRFEGFDGHSLGQLKGTASRFKVTPALLKRASDAGVAVASIDDHFAQEPPVHPLRLKNSSKRNYYGDKIRGKSVAFRRTAQTRQLEAEVTALNSFLSGFTIAGAHHHGFERIFNEGDKPNTYRWNKGGRLYSIPSPSGQQPYQQLNSEARARITIDGEATCEIDVRASNPTIFHAKLREPFDTQTDPYDPSRTGLKRNVAKAWLVASLGANKPIERWSQKTSEDYLKKTLEDLKLSKECRARDARDKMLAAYPALKKIGHEGVTWADLMFAESTAVIQAMTVLMSFGVPSLPVHDSLVVPVSKATVASETMLLSFWGVLGVYPWLTSKTSNTEAQAAILAANRRVRTLPSSQSTASNHLVRHYR